MHLKIIAAFAAFAASTSVLADGACCQDDGACVDLPDAQLCELIFSGIWQGDGTSCATVDCTTGACCIEDFESICYESQTEGDCEAMGGDFLGIQSTCDNEGAYCNSVFGACCMDWSYCKDWLTEEQCWSWGGKFIGPETTCSNEGSWCAINYGSCCYGDYCEDFIDEPSCEAGGGIFWSDECSLLEDILECVDSSGACCFGGFFCEDGWGQDQCEGANGEFIGSYTTCSDQGSDCTQGPLGSCCLEDGSCFIGLEYECDDLPFGEFEPDVYCEDSTCGSCDGDTNGDGFVDVEDLLAVIGNWGTESPECDFDGSGVVDVNDLLMVVGGWGECE
ncbi:MAG: hypothetical protein P8K80_06165 [Phycisphaerales bacterium]|nr:hypothetical protein [Phycisphaerales bacterium]